MRTSIRILISLALLSPSLFAQRVTFWAQNASVSTSPSFPTVRCTTSQQFSTGTSNNITIPACAVAGDLEIIFLSSQNGISSVPSEWFSLTAPCPTSATFITGCAIYKQLTSTDISAGHVTLTTAAGGGITTASVVFSGLPAGGTSSGETNQFLSSGATALTIANPISVGVVPGDTVFYFGSNNGTGAVTSSRGSSLQSLATGSINAVLASENVNTTSAGLTSTFTYTGYSTQGANNIVVVVHGGTTTTPEAIPGLQLWVSADCITRTATTCSTPSTGSTINTSGWVNRYGVANYNNTSITGTCTYNTNKINGLPAVNFSTCALNIGTTPTSALVPTAVTVAGVWANASTAAKGTLIGAATGGPAYWTCASSKEQGFDKQAAVQEGSGTAACDTSWHQTNGIAINGSFPTFRINRATDTTINGGTASFTVVSSAIGRNNSTSNEYFNGDLAELVMYSSQLTSAQITILENYFNGRYAL